MKKELRYTIAFVLLLSAVTVLILLNMGSGSVNLGQSGNAAVILWRIRMPRLIAAALLGGALAVAGFLLQTFFGNPIAGPYVLGISSGAKLAVVCVMIFFLNMGVTISSGAMILAAFAGSMLSMGMILLVSVQIRRMSMLVICGVMIGYICSAITELLVTFANDSNIVNLHNWSMGSFSGISWANVSAMTKLLIPTLIGTWLLSKPIGAFQLGETYAADMGVNVKVFRVLLILLSSLLSACVTAFAGPISFVGIAVPHLMKSLFRTTKPLIILPACFLGGAVFCLFCDLIARTLFAPTELSISSITAIFGAPVVIWMLLKRQVRG